MMLSNIGSAPALTIRVIDQVQSDPSLPEADRDTLVRAVRQ